MAPVTASSDASAPFHPASSSDYLPREPLRRLQSQRLRQAVARAFEHVPLYRQRMQKHGVAPEEIRGVEDLVRLPLTVLGDLHAGYPFGLMAVPVQQVARLYRPGGGTSKPLVVGYTRRDLDAWTEVLVRCLAACGIQPGDVLQNVYGHDWCADALGLHYGAEAMGATVVPTSGDDVDRQLAAMKDFNVTAVCCAPSHFLRLIERAEKTGLDLRELPLRIAVFLAETWSEALRRRIQQAAGIKAYDLFGPSEIIGPGVGAECCCQNGLHVLEDHFYPEIVDPATGAPLPDGQEGELVLTTLAREAMSLIRYRTRDLTAIVAEPCPCGRTMRRIRRIGLHSDDRFVLQGVGVLPSQIEAALLAVEGTSPHYQIVLSQENGLDQAEVLVEVTPQILSDRVRAMERLQSQLAAQIEEALGISVTVRLVESHTLQRSQGKVQRVVDKRAL